MQRRFTRSECEAFAHASTIGAPQGHSLGGRSPTCTVQACGNGEKNGQPCVQAGAAEQQRVAVFFQVSKRVHSLIIGERGEQWLSAKGKEPGNREQEQRRLICVQTHLLEAGAAEARKNCLATGYQQQKRYTIEWLQHSYWQYLCLQCKQRRWRNRLSR